MEPDGGPWSICDISYKSDSKNPVFASLEPLDTARSAR